MEKSAIERMADILDGFHKSMSTHKSEFAEGAKSAYASALAEAQRLAAEEKAKPTAPASLVEELRKTLRKILEDNFYSEGCGVVMKWGPASDAIIEEISRYQPAESLAELVDRKGCYGIECFKISTGEWRVVVSIQKYGAEIFTSPTYAEAESKAREYLNGLPNKGEK